MGDLTEERMEEQEHGWEGSAPVASLLFSSLTLIVVLFIAVRDGKN